jgi:folate-binding protein YgfZ
VIPPGVRALRDGVARLRLPWRGVIEVTGDDRARWLDGMLTNGVTDLAPESARSGCHALALTRQGRVVADVQVLARPDSFLLVLEAAAIPGLLEHLGSFLVADDVTLRDAGADWVCLAVEGPEAGRALLAAGIQLPGADGVREAIVGAAPVLVAGRSLSGRGGFQVLAPGDRADAVWQALESVASEEASLDALELVRIEQGVPRLGHDLGPDVLPAEARLEAAVSETKGCYTGQEVVARMRSRDRVSHLLVGLVFGDGEPPAPGTELEADGHRRGEVTSTARSDRFGAIGLGFVVRSLATGGALLSAAGQEARVVELPFAFPSAAR